MSKYFYLPRAFPIIFFVSITISSLFGQTNIQPLLDKIRYTTPPSENLLQQKIKTNSSDYQLRLAQYFKSKDNLQTKLSAVNNPKLNTVDASDTLYIGKTGNDTTITGNFSHTGPICVLGNKLTIHNATVTNTGNIVMIAGKIAIDSSTVTNIGFIYTLGTSQFSVFRSQLINNGDFYAFGKSVVSIDSSTLHFPQTDFYQLSILLGGTAQMTMKNTTFDCNGMSHGFTVMDTAKLVESNMILHGFTTTGLSFHGSITINKTTQAGEFVITDHSNLDIKNSDTVLLWHQFPDTAVINWTFGTSDTAYNYQFNKTKAGVKGVEYNVKVDSSYQVWWAMMPSSGSNVTVSNSKIRAIGLWFDKANDSTVVTGIKDSSNYSAGTLPISDRTLILNNCYVQTWSLYVFKNAKLNIQSCQVGEIGSQQTSRVYGNTYFLDGTGGYNWTTDSSVAFSTGALVYTYVRSEKTSFFVVGYSVVVNAEAISKSILIVVQTTLLNDPVAKDGAVAYYGNIDKPSANIYANQNVILTGSAYIDRGPTSTLMDFKSWSLYYQKQGDAAWTPIVVGSTSEVRRNFLGTWNTNGLVSGNYILKLTLKSTYLDSVDALLPVVILPGSTGTQELSGLSNISVYPNPATDAFTLEFNSSNETPVDIYLLNALGEKVKAFHSTGATQHTYKIETSSLPEGIYNLEIVNEKGNTNRRVLLIR